MATLFEPMMRIDVAGRIQHGGVHGVIWSYPFSRANPTHPYPTGERMARHAAPGDEGRGLLEMELAPRRLRKSDQSANRDVDKSACLLSDGKERWRHELQTQLR